MTMKPISRGTAALIGVAMLTACGGGGSSAKGDAEAADERSAIEKLEAMSGELQAEADAVVKR